jgi:hypothetical protein
MAFGMDWDGIVLREKNLKSVVFGRWGGEFYCFFHKRRAWQAVRNARRPTPGAGAAASTCFTGYAFVRVKINEKGDLACLGASLKFVNCLLTFKKINPIIDSSKRFDYPLR